eukprot:CAMPEP_0183311506 /NCGR_PEP_ID=MMETSP0160_2-20130417/37336_1 /TAXON_ID=2839 ORGANISM="Odontella Sinensis, Strain Grunow 1884" /NCGR_SAMPLE_ID=MMETSP0160_2 /ASSEMBLY_ACC=CAM_ASM_000250 /LENGTH=305 /DNA_ID=CAMNT_0025476115 /DNA_START=128 /DNA_END=1041 /DNA_ORIENTATION=-
MFTKRYGRSAVSRIVLLLWSLASFHLETAAAWGDRRRHVSVLHPPTASRTMKPRRRRSGGPPFETSPTSSAAAALTVRGGDQPPPQPLHPIDSFINAVDLFGTGVFAFGGAVTAGQTGMDLLGALVVGTITAVGGGTTRDILLQNGVAFWLRMPEFLYVCVAVSASTFLLWPQIERRLGWNDSAHLVCLADAFGLGAFSVVGTQKGADKGLPPPLWVLTALVSCTGGGIIRDVLCRRPARVLHPDRTLYATPPVLGAIVYTVLMNGGWGVTAQQAAVVTFLVTFLTRVWAFDNPARLPHWKTEPA